MKSECGYFLEEVVVTKKVPNVTVVFPEAEAKLLQEAIFNYFFNTPMTADHTKILSDFRILLVNELVHIEEDRGAYLR